MTNHTSGDFKGEMKPAVHKAMVELGLVIPTTPETVELVERQHEDDSDEDDKIANSFARLSLLMKSGDLPPSFCKLKEDYIPQISEDYSMAARNGKGEELPLETTSQIEKDIQKSLKNNKH